MNRFAAAAFIAVLLVGIVFVSRYFSGEKEWTYLTASVEHGEISVVVTASGTLRPVSEVKVGSQLSGRIAELFADFNDEVRQGEILARLDPEMFAAKVREAQAALQVAEANALIQEAAISKAESGLATARSRLAVAKAQMTRTQVLYEEAKRDLESKRALKEANTISRREVDQAQTQLETAAADLRTAELEQDVQEATVLGADAALTMTKADLQNAHAAGKQRRAALEQAEIELRRTAILAPIDGVVIARDVDRGQTVAATLEAPTLFTLAEDLGRMEVHAKIDEADIGRLRVGQHAIFSVDAFPGRSFSGDVAQIRKAPQRFDGVVTYTVVIATENPDLVLLPGMTATVRVEIQRIEDTLKIPNAALRFQPQGSLDMFGADSHVWVLRENRSLQPVAVRLGASDTTNTQILSGLEEGWLVVLGLAPAENDAPRFRIHIGN